IFIPYFLIGVGMLVNVKPLFTSHAAQIVVLVMVIAGTLSKYIAAIVSRRIFRLSSASGLMMFGLTEAHAAGALAMVMVGTSLEVSPGVPLMDNAVLDGVVVMILITCIISSIATDQAARNLKLEG
ncbi:MAG: cation:proton antiporter, partial [Bacteroidaceae bacterium]|nr:cation:proton antiporter [Bacteroidaceae bacterium]